MLDLILATLKRYQAPVSLSFLSQQTNIDPPTLEGMLLTLERKGRVAVVEEPQDDMSLSQCPSCPFHKKCATKKYPPKCYEVVS